MRLSNFVVVTGTVIEKKRRYLNQYINGRLEKEGSGIDRAFIKRRLFAKVGRSLYKNMGSDGSESYAAWVFLPAEQKFESARNICREVGSADLQK